MGKLTTMLRNGKKLHKHIILREDVKAVVVILPLDLTTEIEELTEKYMTDNAGRVNEVIRMNYFNKLLCYHCLRDPDDPSYETKLAESVDEIGKQLDIEDINRVAGAYSELVMEKAPKIELLTEGEFEELKKYLEATTLTDLSTVSHVHLINFHQSIVSYH